MKVQHFFYIVIAMLAAALASQLTQARTIKIYTFNGKSRNMPLPVHVPDANEMQVGKVMWASANVNDSGKFALRPDTLTKFYQFNRGTAYSATDPLTPP